MFWFLLAVAEPSLDAEIEVCQVASEYRPLTLCLAERSFERADAKLNTRWAITFPYVTAKKGPEAARKLRLEQRNWIKRRDRECEAIAAPTPTPQQGRNLMSCMAELTDQRTAELRGMVGKH